jgi:hypothetical protein
LTLFGVLVLGIFREIAVRARHFNFFRKLIVQLVLKSGDLVFKFLFNFFG